MQRSVMRLLGFLAILGSVRANFDYFYFSANGTCPGIYFQCAGPDSVCAHEAVLDKFYCCSGEDYPICRTAPSQCLGSSDDPASSQISCPNGNDPWCCLSGTESCTQRRGQINVCLATQPNIIANVTTAVLNETFSSLSSASPSATAYTIDVKQLTAPSTSSAASTASVTSLATLGSSTSSATAAHASSSGISAGAIAGIVVGAVAAIAAVIGGALLWMRRRKRAPEQTQPLIIEEHHAGDKKAHLPEYEMLPTSYNSQHYPTSYNTQHVPISEMDTTREAQELGNHQREVAELYSEPVELIGSPSAPNDSTRAPGTG